MTHAEYMQVFAEVLAERRTEPLTEELKREDERDAENLWLDLHDILENAPAAEFREYLNQKYKRRRSTK